MYKLAMYNTIKTLLDHGKSVREISRELAVPVWRVPPS